MRFVGNKGRIAFFFLTVSTLVGAMLYLTIESKTAVISGLFAIVLLLLLEAVSKAQEKLGWKYV